MKPTDETAWAVAALAAQAVNSLPDLGMEPCNPEGCAGCGALQIFHDHGTLDDILRPYIAVAGTGSDWWDGDVETGRLRWDYVLARWCIA